MLLFRSIALGLVSALVLLECVHLHTHLHAHDNGRAAHSCCDVRDGAVDTRVVVNPGPADVARERIPTRVVSTDDTRIVDVQRATVDRHMADGAVMRQARIVPSFRNGRAIGVKIYAVRPSGLFALFGLENGDTLASINNLPVLGGDHAWLDALERRPGFLDLEIHRAGAPMRIVVLIHE